MNTKSQPTNEQTVQIVNAIRTAIDKCKHYQAYTGRVKKVIETEIQKVFPGTQVFCGNSCTTLESIRVWGGPFGWHFENNFYMCWNISSGGIYKTVNHWSDQILEECNRCDVSDVMEREVQENALDVELSKLELQAREMMKRLEEIRAKAKAQIAALPIPKAASLRTKSCFWDHPTCATAAKYGALFGKVEIKN